MESKVIIYDESGNIDLDDLKNYLNKNEDIKILINKGAITGMSPLILNTEKYLK